MLQNNLHIASVCKTATAARTVSSNIFYNTKHTIDTDK